MQYIIMQYYENIKAMGKEIMGRRIVGYAKPTLYKQIKEIANKQDTSVSSIVCEAVREYLKLQKKAS